MRYTMMQVCKETGMTYQALKFYCNEGLVPNVKRDKNNRRVFDERDVAWISSLTCLKKCGMSIQEMKEYLDRYMIRDLTQTATFTRVQDMTPEEKAQFEEERKQAEKRVKYTPA